MMKETIMVLACGCALAASAANGAVFGNPVKVEGTESKMMAVCLDGNRLYVGGGPDFYVFDVSEPLRPKKLGHIDGLAYVRQIAVRNGMAYVSAREAGLWIIDATDPAHPRVRSRFDCCELATGVDVAGDVVFLGQRQNGVEFIDVSDPDNPAHIAMRKTDESQSVKYRDGYVYSGDWGSGKLTVFDARDMKNIRQVAYEDLWGYGDGVWLKGKYLYASTGHHAKHRDPATLPFKGVDSETLRLYGGAGPGAGCGHGLDIFDVSDPTHPKRVGRADYPPMYERGLDMWTPRTSANSDIVFCAATHNGLFAVDCSNPANPKVADRWTSPEAGQSGKPSCCIGSVAVGNGCVYVAGMGCGLVVLPAKGAAQETFDQGVLPANASFREPYPTDEKEFWVWKPSKPGQARAVAVAGDVVYAACGDAGLHVLRVRPEGGFEKIGELAGRPRVFDVQVDGKRLYTAEGDRPPAADRTRPQRGSLRVDCEPRPSGAVLAQRREPSVRHLRHRASKRPLPLREVSWLGQVHDGRAYRRRAVHRVQQREQQHHVDRSPRAPESACLDHHEVQLHLAEQRHLPVRRQSGARDEGAGLHVHRAEPGRSARPFALECEAAAGPPDERHPAQGPERHARGEDVPHQPRGGALRFRRP